MKVLLLSPPTKIFEKKVKTSYFFEAPPLGLAYIAAVLEENDIKVEIKDLMKESRIEDVKRVIEKARPDIVGVQCLTNYRFGAIETIKAAKEVDSEIVTLMGGPHATFMHEQLLENYPIDIVVRGEGEYSVLETAKALSEKGKLENIKGISFKKNGKIKANEERPFIKNLNELPMPARHLLDLELYKPSVQDSHLNLLPESKIDGKKITKVKSTTIITTRGCPFKCQFCSTTLFWGNAWRFRSAEKVVEEIEFLQDKYKIKYLPFSEDNFTASPKRVIEICKLLVEKKIDLRWMAPSRADISSIEMVEWMKKAGCVFIGMAPETGSQKILDSIHKRLSIKQVLKAYKICEKAGVKTNMALMVGNPGETQETINETIQLIKKAKPFTIGLNITKILPNTELYDLAQKQGLISDEDWLKQEFNPPFYTAENSLEQLGKWKRQVMLYFYFKQFGLKNLLKYGIVNYDEVLPTISQFVERLNPKSQIT